MRPRLSPRLAAALLCTPVHAQAAEEQQSNVRFDVSGGRLSVALPRLSRQAGVSISVADADLWKRRARSVRRRMSVDAAIARMLAGPGARAVRVRGPRQAGREGRRVRRGTSV